LTVDPVLQIRSIGKRFPGVVALDQVDFAVARGEIVALVGENGAGKSTLMKILAGVYRPDAGDIRIDGVAVIIDGPSGADRLGVAVIHQELEMIDTLDVAGNIFLGREPHRAGPLRLLDRARMEQEARQHLSRIGASIAPRTIVGQLSTAQQQFVAIARALSVEARILILDEPTASLGADDAERLFGVLKQLQARGTAIVYISHRLAEVEAIADRVVVLRDGRNAGTLARSEIRRDRLVHLMVGRALESEYASRRQAPVAPPDQSRTPRLQIDRVRTARHPDVEVSLTVHRGEVLGIAGLIGAGRSELAEAVCGIASRLSGRVLLDGAPLAIATPGDAIHHGICLVPEDRRGRGVIGAMSVRENLTLPNLSTYTRLGLVNRRAESSAAREIVSNLTVKAPSIEAAVGTLSGGNQQKVVLGKWLALEPRAIVFDEPTQGVDVGAKAEIHRLIRRLADDGAAVVLISSDLEEIVAECDRVAVMHDGRVTGVLDRLDCTPQAIMQLAVA
jgi:ribose transport system ATP-binding protein